MDREPPGVVVAGDQHVALTVEDPGGAFDLVHMSGREIEEEVRPHLVEHSAQSLEVSPVDLAIAREGPVGAVLPPRGDGLNAPPHEFLAGCRANEAGASQYQCSHGVKQA